MKLASDILGLLGIIFTVVLYQQKRRKSLLAYKLTLDIVWLFHYALIGAYSGAAVCVIAAIREVVFAKRDRNNKKGILWLPFFIVIAILCTIFTWDNVFSLFTCLASCIAVISFFIGIPRLSRILAFPVSICMLIYDAVSRSIAGVVNEVFALTSSLIGIIRLDRKKSKSDT